VPRQVGWRLRAGARSPAAARAGTDLLLPVPLLDSALREKRRCPWNSKMKSILTLSVLVLAFTGTGCGGSTKSATTTTTPAATNEAKATTPASVTKDELTGFGATVTTWNDHHQEDPRFDPGSAYDPDPSLGDGERFNSRYYGVSAGEGRVTFYNMRFPAQTGIEEAKAFVLTSEFPGDAKIVWFKREDTCALMLVRSKKVARAGIEAALIAFTSGEGGDTYNPRAVGDAIVMESPLSAESPGC